MPEEYGKIYQIARQSAGYTQEKAAELIDVSVESIRAYESTRRPPDNVVVRMIEVYGTPHLAYQHLKSSELGQRYIPKLEIRDLPTALLRLQKEATEAIKHRDDLIGMACDGVITEAERPHWDAILEELDDVSEAIMALKFAHK